VDAKTTLHVISHCLSDLPAIGHRQNLVFMEIFKNNNGAGHEATVNRVFPGSILIPDILVTLATPPIIIDVAITFDAPKGLTTGHPRKIEKYSCLGLTLPFVIGALGSWLPSNNAVAATLGILPVPWRHLRKKCRLMAIRGQSPSSTAMFAATKRWTTLSSLLPNLLSSLLSLLSHPDYLVR
jgi:hypothetical protein